MAETVGMVNQYDCPTCGKSIVTIIREHGVTPYWIHCQTIGCPSLMQSRFYRVDQSLQPTHEWYKPGFMEYKRLSPSVQRHVGLGGLLLQPIRKEVANA